MFRSSHLRSLIALASLIIVPGTRAQDGTKPATVGSTPQKDASSRKAASKADIKQSERLFNRALRLTSSDDTLPDAFDILGDSAALYPTDKAIASTREFVRQQLVSEHLERGNRFMEQHRQVEAAGEFREALALDPTNAFTQQRLHDVWADAEPAPAQPTSFEYASEAVLQPTAGKRSFSFRGGTQQMIEEIGRAFGVRAIFDSSFEPRQVRFEVQDVDFFTAMRIARMLSHSFYVPVSANEMLLANDSQDGRRNAERLSLRTFTVPVSNEQDLIEMSNLLRVLFDLRFIQTDQSASTVTIRAPQEILDAAAKLIHNLTEGPPEVLLEIHAYEISKTGSQQLGINVPSEFTVFNLTTEAAKLGPSAQELINRFLAGTLSPTDLIAAQALLASGALANSPLLKGFATFGGGITKSGVVISPGTAHFNYNHSLAKNLENMTLRAQQNNAATFRIGERFPVITNTFGSTLSALLPSSLRSGLQSIVPGFTYEDLGVTLKATPHVSARQDVTLQLDLAIRALAGVSFNNIPTISNREYTGTITVRDGETSLMAGEMDSSEQKSLTGLPLISQIPGLGSVLGNHSTQTSSDQLLLLITPHVIRPRSRRESTETYLDGN